MPNSSGESPSASAFAITPSDSVDLTKAIRGIYIGGAGNLSVILEDDSVEVTLTGVVAGSIYPLRAKRVRSTGTTATSLIGLV